jgi:DMSO/TMAO reductase YedYZ heme-binding membrane subunit
MQKSSWLFLLLICAVALLGAYQALFPIPASTSYIRFFALSAYLLLCVSLMIGPLTVLYPQTFAQTVEPRRAVGIACFVFAILHGILVIWLKWDWGLAPLLVSLGSLATIPATLILLALTLTSSDYAIKKMGPALWKNVQRFNYLAFAFSSVHFILLANGLFVQVNGKTFVNIAEVALLLLGIATIGLQLAGFFSRRKRMAQMKTGAPASESVGAVRQAV